MKRYSHLLCVILALVLSPALLAQITVEAAFVSKEEVTVLQGRKWGAKVNLPALPQGHRAVLVFRAWYQAPKFSGYYRHLRVVWDRTQLTEVLDRPTTFTTVGGHTLDSFTEVGLLVPATDDPEQIKGDSLYQTRYRPEQDEDIDLSTFRFVLFNVNAAGEHTVVFENLFSDAEGKYHTTLQLRDIRILFEPIP